MADEGHEELRDDAVIVRFGIMELQHVWNSLHDAMEDPEVQGWELSFFGGNDMDAEEIAKIAARPNGKMRRTTARRLRGEGFSPFPDEPPPAHVGLIFDAKPTDEELIRLISLFDLPEENPHSFK